MRIGTTVGIPLDGPLTLDDVVDEVRAAAAAGLSSAWTNQVTSWDALTVLAVAGPAAGAPPPAMLLAALGPVMLRIAGELTDGTVATWTTARALEDHVVPRLAAAAEAVGRPAPRVVVSLPVTVTSDEDGARAWVAETFGMAAGLPSYRAVLDVGGADGVEETVVAGDEAAVERQLRRLEDAGMTEFIAVPFGPPDQKARAVEVLAALADHEPTPA